MLFFFFSFEMHIARKASSTQGIKRVVRVPSKKVEVSHHMQNVRGDAKENVVSTHHNNFVHSCLLHTF